MFLQMVARPLMAKVTQTTGIKVREPNLRDVLIGIYSKTLNEIKKLPKDNTFRELVERHTDYKLKICKEEEDAEYIPGRLLIFDGQVGAFVEEARRYLSEICGVVADWHSDTIRPLQLPPLSRRATAVVELYGNLTERELLIYFYKEALNVVRTVPKNNKLRMFAETSITRKLKVCLREDDWELIKIKLDYEDPIQKAREEFDHWTLFFGQDAHLNREFPHVPRTKEFLERFDAWRELASLEILKSNSSDKCHIKF